MIEHGFKLLSSREEEFFADFGPESLLHETLSAEVAECKFKRGIRRLHRMEGRIL